MQININDIIRENGNRMDDQNPIFRIVEYINMLMSFCWYVFVFGLLAFFILPGCPAAWECLGAAGVALVIFIGTMRFLMSLIPQDMIDDMYNELRNKLEEHNDDCEHKSEEQHKDNNHKLDKQTNKNDEDKAK